MSSIYFADAVGTKLQFVPFRGGGPAMQEMIAGRIDLMLDQAANALGHVRAGTIKAYAVMAKERWSALPDVPTIDEVRHPRTLCCLLARDVGAEGHAEGDHREAQRRGRAGARRSQRPASGWPVWARTSWPREQQTPEALAAHHKAETDKWWPIVKATGLKAD